MEKHGSEILNPNNCGADCRVTGCVRSDEGFMRAVLTCYIPSILAELEAEREKVKRYAQSARTIALWLDDYCDATLPYPEMIADASRKAATEIDMLEKEVRTMKGDKI
jgi:ketopantoate reductase